MKRVWFSIVALSLLMAAPVLAQEGPNPDARISWPPSVYVLRGAVEVRGSAALADMAGYFIEYTALPAGALLPDSSAVWFPATLPVNAPVQDGVLGTWDTATGEDGLYALRLTINTAGGAVQHIVSPLRVENNPPPFVAVEPVPASGQGAVDLGPANPLPAGSPNADWAPVERDVNGLTFVYVPAGCFMMGRDYDDERPVTEICLDPFWITKTEITNAQYASCVNAGVCEPPAFFESNDRDSYFDNPDFADYPVIYVNWFQALAFAEWIGGTLPSEAEWEYAARGPEAWTYPWGEDEPTTALLNYDNDVSDTSLVGAYPKGASWVGALDIGGSVSEWTRSLYRDYPYDPDDGRELLDPTLDAERVSRGSAFHMGSYLESSVRWTESPDRSDDTLGIRVVVYDIDAAQYEAVPAPPSN